MSYASPPRSVRRLFLLALASTFVMAPAVSVQAAETVTLGGVGGISPLVRRLAADYQKRNPGVDIVVINPPLGTNGGLRALAAGKVDIALSGRDLKAGESGTAKHWVESPLVLATNGDKHKGLTRQELADIYAGRNSTWADGAAVRLILRSEMDTETAALRSMSPEVDVAVTASLKRSGLPMAENDLDAIEKLGRISGSLGTTTLGLIKADGAKLQVIAIDGVMPNAKNMESGAYRWKRSFYLVTGAAPKPAAVAFVGYLNSAPAMKLARELEYVPAK